MHAIVNSCSLAWGIPAFKLRKISGLMKELQEAIKTTKESPAKLLFLGHFLSVKGGYPPNHFFGQFSGTPNPLGFF